MYVEKMLTSNLYQTQGMSQSSYCCNNISSVWLEDSITFVLHIQELDTIRCIIIFFSHEIMEACLKLSYAKINNSFKKNVLTYSTLIILNVFFIVVFLFFASCLVYLDFYRTQDRSIA